MSKRARRYRPKRRQRCRFCQDGVEHIDYKDTEKLRKLITVRGKLMARKRSGNCAKCQRQVRIAVKRARFLALLPHASK